jgi:hypothetical protein
MTRLRWVSFAIGERLPEYPVDALRWLREPVQEDSDDLARQLKKLSDEKPLVDRCVKGEVRVHINVGLRAGPLDVDASEFCTCSSLNRTFGATSRRRMQCSGSPRVYVAFSGTATTG